MHAIIHGNNTRDWTLHKIDGTGLKGTGTELRNNSMDYNLKIGNFILLNASDPHNIITKLTKFRPLLRLCIVVPFHQVSRLVLDRQVSFINFLSEEEVPHIDRSRTLPCAAPAMF